MSYNIEYWTIFAAIIFVGYLTAMVVNTVFFCLATG